MRMRNGCASSKAILQEALGAAGCTTVMNASHINSSASETLYRVSRNLNVLKRGIDAIKIIGRVVVVRHRFAEDGNRGVSVRISAHGRPVLIGLCGPVGSYESVVADGHVRTWRAFAPVARKMKTYPTHGQRFECRILNHSVQRPQDNSTPDFFSYRHSRHVKAGWNVVHIDRFQPGAQKVHALL